MTWVAPADNNSPITDYELQHREMGATTWTHTPSLGTSTQRTFTGLTDGTVYEFQVRARNAVDWSPWSAIAPGTPMASAAVPDAPVKPMVTATADTLGSLVVTWVAPADNGSAIIDYGLQYKRDEFGELDHHDGGHYRNLHDPLRVGRWYVVRRSGTGAGISTAGRSLWSPTGDREHGSRT